MATTTEDPFDAFVRQVIPQESLGSVDPTVLASVASALLTHERTTTGKTKAAKRKAAAEGSNHCPDCKTSLLNSNSLRHVVCIKSPRCLTRSQRRRSARRRKTTRDDTLCCKTLQIYTCHGCRGRFATPGVRNPRPQRVRQKTKDTTFLPKFGKNAITLPQDSSNSRKKRSMDAAVESAVRTTLDDGKKRKKKKQKNPTKNGLLEFLSSLND